MGNLFFEFSLEARVRELEELKKELTFPLEFELDFIVKNELDYHI